ncbi:MAG: glycosyltransferase [Treponema sp.]|nr:glycosyltransferase [Treponema sp.]
MKVAIVHDWLTNYGGAETFVELWLRMYPNADIYTLVYDKKKMKGHFEGVKIYTSSLQKLPFATKIYTKLLKFMPKAFESFDLSGYDLVLCSSSSCAKGVIVPPHIPQVAYIHTPMRYAWDLYFDYKKRSGRLTRFFMDKWMGSIRLWDYASSQRIDTIVANSYYIARRIEKFWNRKATVIYSPLNHRRFFPAEKPHHEDFYVAFSRLVPYKRVDLAISAIKGSGRKLVVIGGGSESEKLKELAAGDNNITFTGRVSDEVLRGYLQTCRALIFCAEEDFGLTPLETQACGRPVIAFGRGGATETVIDGKTGIFFEKQTAESVKEAIIRFEEMDNKNCFDTETISAHARSFTEERFQKEFTAIVEKTRQKICNKNFETR